MKPIDIDANCKFLQDAKTNQQMAMYNLICSKRDVKLWAKGIKPHRRWKISDVKWYFGMNGNAETLAKKLDTLYNVITEGDKNE